MHIGSKALLGLDDILTRAIVIEVIMVAVFLTNLQP